MSRQIRADYTQNFLLPPSLEDWVGPEHPARFIRAFVESLDWPALGVDWNAGVEGRPTYGADLLLKVWLYGYFVGIRSTRRLESACREQMGLLWLTGLNAPDHNTLWRFFERNRAALRGVFGQSVKVAVNAQMVGLALHALDGTKIGAQPSTAEGWHREQLSRQLARLDEIIQGWEEEIEHSAAPEAPGTGIPEALHQERRLREEVRKALSTLDEAGQNHLHPGDPDARVMKCPDTKSNRFAYNSQAVVDADSGLIVAQEVSNHANDQQQLAPMLDLVEGTLGVCAALTVADAGYASGPSLARVDHQQRAVAVNLPPSWTAHPNPYHASHFTYHQSSDTVICPRGHALTYQLTRHHCRIDHPLRRYHCDNRSCPVRAQCTREARGRNIELTPYHTAIERHKERLNQPDVIHALRRRPGIIENIFGTIKYARGFRRYTLRGLDKVRTQWALICAAHNLHKLYQQHLATSPPAQSPYLRLPATY